MTRRWLEGHEVFGRLLAVELDDPQAEPVGQLGDLAWRAIDEEADGRGRMGRAATISAARPGSTHRGEPGWKFRPIQSAPAAAQANASATGSGRRP